MGKITQSNSKPYRLKFAGAQVHYNGLFARLDEAGREDLNSLVLLLGGDLIIGENVEHRCEKEGCDIRWYAPPGGRRLCLNHDFEAGVDAGYGTGVRRRRGGRA